MMRLGLMKQNMEMASIRQGTLKLRNDGVHFLRVTIASPLE